MVRHPKILIVYARYGEGHWQAANALRLSLIKNSRANVVLIDLLKESHPFINKVSRYIYNKSYVVLPQVYGWIYQKTKRMKPTASFANLLHSFGMQKMVQLAKTEKPDAIIHTFPFLAWPYALQRLKKNVPIYNVITDFDLHSRWIHPRIDKYYVATSDLQHQLCSQGIKKDRIKVTGIPIRPQFEQSNQFAHSAVLLGAKPFVLLMAGREFQTRTLKKLILHLIPNCAVRVVIICGRNRSLFNCLQNDFNGCQDVLLLSYVKDLPQWMSSAACIITKPGGLTLTEALASALPIYLYRPVPGQELNNANYFAHKGAATICWTPPQLVEAINEQFSCPNQKEKMLSAIRSLHKKNAADTIALDVLNFNRLKENTFEAQTVKN